ncbi:hypothetical protein [Spirillospora sp. CA-294931]|uniref:hypothetical protein n=1 Tax=Spirillospora sp. CA-294931 TaxID=3240042 RepID=UPI003D94F889
MFTTVVLVLLCLAIGGRELYLASDKRLPRALTEIRDLRVQLTELSKRHEALRADIGDEPSGIPIPHPGEAPSEVLDRLEATTGRLDRLEHELGTVAARLAGLDLDRDAQRALARSLDTVEQVTRELQREMVERLAREEGVVSGLLLSEEGEAEALLADAYERCASEYGLRVRVRDQRSAPATKGEYWGTAYHLSGRSPDPLAEEMFGYVRGLYDPRDPSALTALVSELANLRGGGIARLGAFTAVRTQNTLLCGLLPEDGLPTTEPWELASQLRELPGDLQCDLTWLRTHD